MLSEQLIKTVEERKNYITSYYKVFQNNYTGLPSYENNKNLSTIQRKFLVELEHIVFRMSEPLK